LPAVPADADPAWHLFVVTHDRADELRSRLERAGIAARGYYRTPLHRQPAMAEYAAAGELPATEELARTNLALPISPVLSAGEAAEVVAAASSALA
jgi:dTDP-3-amino-3,4,6-trideoxy-alpha-D-glucose transaminase